MFNRRSFMQLGSLGIFGLSLPRVLELQAAQPSTSRRDVGCIVFWMGGGPSNIDTFDMKPTAPAEIRGEFQPIATSVPGVQICEHLPRVAKHMDRICLVRSVTHAQSGDHVAACHHMLTGYPQRPDPSGQPANSIIYPSYGSVVSRELGWRQQMPPYVVLTGEMTPYNGAGYLGSAFDPLSIRNDPNQPDFAVDDVSIAPEVGVTRTQRRQRMLDAFDRWRAQTESTRGIVAERNQFYEQAYNLITSPAAQRAFRLDQEPAALRDRYGRHRYGQSCLLARRLIEAGVRFVAVETNWWDTHQDNFRDLKGTRLPNLDQCYSALLEDMDQRGLLENNLVIWMGEFGRTPQINGRAGRDHWAYTNAICLSGAGVRMGTVVGETDRRCERPVGTGHSTHDFAATIYRLLGIDLGLEYRSADGRPLLLNYHGVPIRDVLA